MMWSDQLGVEESVVLSRYKERLTNKLLRKEKHLLTYHKLVILAPASNQTPESLGEALSPTPNSLSSAGGISTFLRRLERQSPASRKGRLRPRCLPWSETES